MNFGMYRKALWILTCVTVTVLTSCASDSDNTDKPQKQHHHRDQQNNSSNSSNAWLNSDATPTTQGAPDAVV